MQSFQYWVFRHQICYCSIKSNTRHLCFHCLEMVEEITVHSSLYTNSNSNEKRIPLNVPYAKMNLNHFFISGAATGTHYFFLLFSSGMSVHESVSDFFFIFDISVCIVVFFFFSFSSQFICSKAKFFVFACM